MEVSHDGKTAYERCKGKSAKVLGIEFGEAVMWKRKPSGGGLGKLQSMWDDGVFLGIKGTTGEFIVGDGLGIRRTRTVQRRPAEQRWDADNLKLVAGVPWRHSDEDPKMDGEAMQMRPLTEQEKKDIEERREWRETVPKRFGIRMKDVEDFNPTMGCKKCETQLKGGHRRPHTEACRQRFEKLLGGDERVKMSRLRVDEFMSKAIEKSCGAQDEARRAADPELAVAGARLPSHGGLEKSPDLGTFPASGSVPQMQQRQDRMDVEERGEKRARVDSSEMMLQDDLQEHKRQMTGTVEVHAVNDEFEEWATDDITNDELDPAEVRASRMEEMQFVKKMPVYEERSLEECWSRTGRPPTSTRWVDSKKGDGVRSRWVARDFKAVGTEKRDDLFAAMPPLEAKKILFKLAARLFDGSETKRKRKMKLLFVDVSKAHLNGVCDADFYVELPEEAAAERRGAGSCSGGSTESGQQRRAGKRTTAEDLKRLGMYGANLLQSWHSIRRRRQG